MLQGILRCGECDSSVQSRAHRTSYGRTHRYYCAASHNYPEESHPKNQWGGRRLDYRVWRYIVDQCIHRPDMISEQVMTKRAELQDQGDDLNAEITRAQGKLTEIDQERAFYQRQTARGKVTEQEFDDRMDETAEQRDYWLAEIERLKELRDDTRKIDAGLNYANTFLASLREGVDDLDMTPRELNQLSRDERNEVLTERRKIILALCETIYVYADP